MGANAFRQLDRAGPRRAAFEPRVQRMMAVHQPEERRVRRSKFDEGYSLRDEGIMSVGFIVGRRQNAQERCESVVRDGGYQAGLIGEMILGRYRRNARRPRPSGWLLLFRFEDGQRGLDQRFPQSDLCSHPRPPYLQCKLFCVAR